jgi:hypothetical protein
MGAAAARSPARPERLNGATPAKWVYDFAQGRSDMRDLLGGKGANVAEMTRVLGSERVPPGGQAKSQGRRMRRARRRPGIDRVLRLCRA